MTNEAIRKQAKPGSWRRPTTPPRAEDEANKGNGMGQILACRLLPTGGRRAGRRARRDRLHSTKPWGSRKRLERQGLEAYQSEPDLAHFGTGNQGLETGRK